jgi:hypothetical protein
MVIVSLCGEISSEIREGASTTNVTRAYFSVRSEDENSLPLQHDLVAFGKLGDRALAELQIGTKIFCTGRLSAGGSQKRVSVVLSAFEIVGGVQDVAP